MLSQRVANIAFMILVLLVSAYFYVQAEGFEAAGLLASSGLPSKFFPQLLLLLMGLCATIVLVTYVTKGSSGGDEGETVYGAPVDAMRGLATLAAVLVAYGIWRTWGYVPMMLFLGPATLLTMGVRNPVIYVVVLALAGGIYLVFTQFLGTQF